MAQTDTQTHISTDGHGDSMTNSAQWGRVGENCLDKKSQWSGRRPTLKVNFSAHLSPIVSQFAVQNYHLYYSQIFSAQDQRHFENSDFFGAWHQKARFGINVL